MIVATGAARPATPISALTLLRQPRKRPHLSLLRSLFSSSPTQLELEVELELGLGITELAGAAGTGKTQLALALCVQAVTCKVVTVDDTPASPQIYYKALYLSLGEGTTQTKLAQRLEQMVTAQQHPLGTLQRILIRMVRNQDEFLEMLRIDIPAMLQRQRFGIIVLDSIAGMFRLPDVMTDTTFVPQRSNTLFYVAATLQRLSEHHPLPILVINQVTALWASKSDAVIPALGLSWANCVTTSYMVCRSEPTTMSNKPSEVRRIVTVRQSAKIVTGTNHSFAIAAVGPILLHKTNR
jgi:RecA/RadA recombinase